MSRISLSVLRASLGLKHISQTFLLSMPRSIDLSSYSPNSLGEEDHFLPLARDSTDDDDDSASLLEKGNAPLRAEEQQQQERARRKASRRWCLRSPWLFLVDALLVVMTMTVWASASNTGHLSLLGDVTGYVPSFDQQIVVFGSHPEFISNHTSLDSLKEAREHWKTLLPPGQGYIKVTDRMYDKYDLPKAVEYKGTKSLGTSMMHSLHCLYEIMAEYDMLSLGLRPPPAQRPTTPDGKSPTEHLDHCFDYVRQMLLCGGDTALAGNDLPGGSSQLHVPHVCKNFGQVYKWLDGHRDNDAYQFGGMGNHYLPP